VVAVPAAEPTIGDWQPLFDGSTIAGWQVHGGGHRFHVEDGAIVGTCVQGEANGFLSPQAAFADFELRFAVKVDDGLNSGVQVRSWPSADHGGALRGPQVEIDPRSAAFIYGERSGGWHSVKVDREDPARQVFRSGEWNDYRVLVVGDRIQTWLNEVAIEDLTFARPVAANGLIGLQVHQHRQPGAQVRWRDVQVRVIDPAVTPTSK
jgi:hypothetical protein